MRTERRTGRVDWLIVVPAAAFCFWLVIPDMLGFTLCTLTLWHHWVRR